MKDLDREWNDYISVTEKYSGMNYESLDAVKIKKKKSALGGVLLGWRNSRDHEFVQGSHGG